jgi:hypothetical protein
MGDLLVAADQTDGRRGCLGAVAGEPARSTDVRQSAIWLAFQLERTLGFPVSELWGKKSAICGFPVSAFWEFL